MHFCEQDVMCFFLQCMVIGEELLTLTRMAIWPLLTRMAKECYTHGSVDVFRRILRPLSAAEDS